MQVKVPNHSKHIGIILYNYILRYWVLYSNLNSLLLSIFHLCSEIAKIWKLFSVNMQQIDIIFTSSQQVQRLYGTVFISIVGFSANGTNQHCCWRWIFCITYYQCLVLSLTLIHLHVNAKLQNKTFKYIFVLSNSRDFGSNFNKFISGVDKQQE